MPSEAHEMPLELIRDRPTLVLDLLERSCGISLPRDSPVRIGAEACTRIKPLAPIKDRTVMIGEPGAMRRALLVESQLRSDEDKEFAWPLYLAELRWVNRCKSMLVVIAPDAITAAALAKPIVTGHPNYDLAPVVIVLDELPPVTDVEEARRNPEYTIISTPGNADGPAAKAQLTCYAAAMETLDRDRGCRYDDYVRSRLSVSAQGILEAILPAEGYVWQSDFALEHQALGRTEGRSEGRSEGRCEGEAKVVLRILARRGIEATSQQRDWITQCTDEDTLMTWADRAMTASTADEIFG